MKKRKIQKLDGNDPLGSFRERFYLSQNRIYLDGNSLGPAPIKGLPGNGNGSFRGMGRRPDPKLEQHGLVGTVGTVWRPAGPIGGSGTGQVVVCDTTTVNLYNVLDAALSESPI